MLSYSNETTTGTNLIRKQGEICNIGYFANMHAVNKRRRGRLNIES